MFSDKWEAYLKRQHLIWVFSLNFNVYKSKKIYKTCS